MLSDEFITECRRRFDSDPSTETLLELLDAAYLEGRQSVYDTDEWRTVWRTRFGDIAVWCRGIDHDETYCLKQCRGRGHPDAWIEHRRTGATAWERVGDVDV